MGGFITCFQRTEEGLSVLALAASQVASIQNNISLSYILGDLLLASAASFFHFPCFHILLLKCESFSTSGSLAFCLPTNYFFQRLNVLRISVFSSVLMFLESYFQFQKYKKQLYLTRGNILSNFKKTQQSGYLVRKEASTQHQSKVGGGLKQIHHEWDNNKSKDLMMSENFHKRLFITCTNVIKTPCLSRKGGQLISRKHGSIIFLNWQVYNCLQRMRNNLHFLSSILLI